MALIGDAVGKITGGFNLGGITSSFTKTMLTLILVGVIITLIVGIGLVIINGRRWNRRVVLWSKIRGKWYPTNKYKARLIKVGQYGVHHLQINVGGGQKIARSAYSPMMDKNTYYFVLGDDGTWYSVDGFNFDKTLKELGIRLVPAPMKLLHTGLGMTIDREHGDQESWAKKNIGLIIGITMIALIFLFIWLMSDKFLTLVGRITEAVDAGERVMGKTELIIGKLDNICTGSGISST